MAAVAATTLLAVPVTTQAAAFTLGFTGYGQFAYAGSDLGNATSITIPSATQMYVNSVPLHVGISDPNWFYGKIDQLSIVPYVAPTMVTVNPVALDTTSGTPKSGGVALAGPYLDFTTTPATGSQEIQFTLSSITWTHSSNNDLSFVGFGTISDITDPSQFNNSPATLSGSFTQANLKSAVNASFTLIPEPATYGFIAGLGLLGFGLWHRRNA
jgi:hypothetical protein